MVKNVKGAMIYGIVFITAVSWFRNTKVTAFPHTAAGTLYSMAHFAGFLALFLQVTTSPSIL
ncbi:hypothetical protein PVL29_018347 [Vitis rotundifolia]|uniref:Uncharacterized protein n=1 Tax=Vitis rotundifolia TaxID=103349 RepID=A0AA38Z4U1_VITRO|nr:hypothetical protein PVL29_018347 [Vitis rotundifolia]